MVRVKDNTFPFSTFGMLRPNMFISITLLPELPPTNFTWIRTFVRMNPPVIIQRIRSEESFLTYLQN